MREKFTPALAFRTLTPLFDKASELLGFGNSFRKRVVDMAEIKDGERIIDVGCGTGSLFGHGRMCLDSASLLRLMVSAAMAMF